MAKDKLFRITTTGQGESRVHELYAPDEDEARLRVQIIERDYENDPDDSLVGYKIKSVEQA